MDKIFGTVLSILSVFSNFGRLMFYKKSFVEEFYYTKDDGYGGYEKITNTEKADNYSINLCLEIHNKSNNNRTIRDLKIAYEKDKKQIKSAPLKDDSTKTKIAMANHYEDVTSLNIPAKTISTFNLHNIINKDDEIWDYALNSTAIYLTYRNERNHIKKVRLKKKGGKDGR